MDRLSVASCVHSATYSGRRVMRVATVAAAEAAALVTSEVAVAKTAMGEEAKEMSTAAAGAEAP